jgi:predicted DNA-binding transcriptional regulator AlpA
MSARTLTRPPYTPITLAERLGISLRTVQSMRTDGRGPEWYRAGRRNVRYEFEAVEHWIAENSGH